MPSRFDLYMTGAREAELGPLVRDYHYSRRMAGLVHHAFAWRRPGGLFGDTGEPIAAVTYSQPVSRNLPQDALELSRLVRRDDADVRLSSFVAWSLRWLRRNTPTPFVLSYADPGAGHHGGIYQALGFIYVGPMGGGHLGFTAPDGSFVHGRICNGRFGTRSVEQMKRIRPDWQPIYGEAKHLYIFPLRQRVRSVLCRQNWKQHPFPKPNATRPVDELMPIGASAVKPRGVAPIGTNSC